MKARLILGNNLDLEREMTGEHLEHLLEIFDTVEDDPTFEGVGLHNPYKPKLETQL